MPISIYDHGCVMGLTAPEKSVEVHLYSTRADGKEVYWRLPQMFQVRQEMRSIEQGYSYAELKMNPGCEDSFYFFIKRVDYEAEKR